jgi:hypothetical protein
MGQIFKLLVKNQAHFVDASLITPALVAEKNLSDCCFVDYRQLCRMVVDAEKATFVKMTTLPKYKSTMDFVGMRDNTYMFCYPAKIQYFCGDKFETDYKKDDLCVLYEPFASHAYLLNLPLVDIQPIVDFAAGKMFTKPQVVRFTLNVDGKQKQRSFDVTLSGLKPAQP